MKLPPALALLTANCCSIWAMLAIGDELVRVETNLVFLGQATKAGDVDDSRNILELLLEGPVFDRLLLHDIDTRILAFNGVPVDLPSRAPVRLQLWHESRR